MPGRVDIRILFICGGVAISSGCGPARDTEPRHLERASSALLSGASGPTYSSYVETSALETQVLGLEQTRVMMSLPLANLGVGETLDVIASVEVTNDVITSYSNTTDFYVELHATHALRSIESNVRRLHQRRTGQPYSNSILHLTSAPKLPSDDDEMSFTLS